MNARIGAILLVWLSCTLAATFAPPRLQGPQDRPKPFLHPQHVPNAWVDDRVEEVWRDCRGCHQFAVGRPVSAPQEHCASCHVQAKVGNALVDTLQPKPDVGWEKDLSKHSTRTREAFRHHKHGMLECRECHKPERDFLVAKPWLNSGPGQCVRCHDPSMVTAESVAGLKWFKAALEDDSAKRLGMVPYKLPAAAVLARRLVDVFADPKAGINQSPGLSPGGDFDHGDHLGLDCKVCHSNIPTASATQVGTGSISLDSLDGCKACHYRDAKQTPVVPAPKALQKPRDLLALGAFSHADHFRWKPPAAKSVTKVCTEDAYRELAGEGSASCTVCHDYAPTVPGRGDRNFPFGTAKSRERYGACIVCHAVPGWQTGETPLKPLHASTAVGAAATASHWNECARCHEFGDSKFVGVRPMETVARVSGRTFQFPANTHPDITSAGTDKATAEGRQAVKDCAECHRAKVPALSSRLLLKQFTHASHLVGNPGPTACLECHPGAVKDAPSLSVNGDGRTYSLQSCGKCHWGGAVTEAGAKGEGLSQRTVVRFQHGTHVGKHVCADCHDGFGGRDIVTKGGALACNQCHDHKKGGPETERIFGDEAMSCASCHHDAEPSAGQRAIASVPPIRGSEAARLDRRYRAEQAAFSGFIDSQFHPLNVACAKCHSANGLEPLALPISVHVKGVPIRSPHTGEGYEPAACLRCHCKPKGSWGAAVDRSVSPEAEKAPRYDPESPDTRKAFGNDSAGYPGASAAKG